MGIPRESTPIKNEILIEIFAKRKLTLREISIVSYIIRHSWGYDDKKNNRRQDWTKPMTISQIAKNINMNQANTSKTINSMIQRNILLRKKDCYQFNEHYNKWGMLKRHMSNQHMLKQHSKYVKSTYQVCQNDISNPSNNKKTNIDTNPKETIKETIKENIYIAQVLNHWNSIDVEGWKKIDVSKNTKTLKNVKKRLSEKLKDYTSEQIKEAINKLAICLNDKKHYWTHKPLLYFFLGDQKNMVERFLNEIEIDKDKLEADQFVKKIREELKDE